MAAQRRGCFSAIFIWWVFRFSIQSSSLMFECAQTGHLTLKANTTAALESYTKASEGWGSPEAQYKLGFLYGSNFGGAVDGFEGVGKQGSVGRSF